MPALVRLARAAAQKQHQDNNEMVCGVPRSDTDVLEAAIRAVFDAIGYKLPVDPEREAYDKWCADKGCFFSEPHVFEAFKAGRRDAMQINPSCFPQTATQPANDGWIPWNGGAHSPADVDAITRVRFRSGNESETAPGKARRFYWLHDSAPDDILAYKTIPQTTAP